MNRSLIFTAIVILGFLAGTMASSGKSQSSGFELSEGNIAFTKKLYGALKSNPGNIFYSPTSLEFALALLYAGTDGKTAEQIRNALLLPNCKETTYSAVSSSLGGLTGSKNVTLNIANGLFPHAKCQLKSSYVDIAKKYFASRVTKVDFASQEAVKTINDFVAKETREKIKELFEQGAFDDLTRLVIVNAIYFKGNWAFKFDPSASFKGDFHLNKKEKVQVDFMKQTRRFKVGCQEEMNATVVVLPYEDEKLSMVLLVPSEIDGLEKIEEKLPEVNFVELVKRTYPEEVILTMPKFKLSQTLNLKKTLFDLGMSEMFTDKADLSGISDEPLLVSDVVQKTYIEVNEEGAEAAAATGIVNVLRMMPLPPRELKLDSPFAFLIYDSVTETVLFIGRMSSP